MPPSPPPPCPAPPRPAQIPPSPVALYFVLWSQVSEESYFFRLSKYTEQLREHIEAHEDFVMPSSRRNEVLSFMREGLRDLSISRTTFGWGIPVPADVERPDAHVGHVMYVWLDALTNYITALGYPDVESGAFTKFWPACLHMVGKDILRFHAVYWPAFLLAAGLPLPKKLFAHGWWTVDGAKMSKSVGNVINPLSLVETYGCDQTRFFMIDEVSFGSDGDFSHSRMIECINAKLSNGLGNLAYRTLSFTWVKSWLVLPSLPMTPSWARTLKDCPALPTATAHRYKNCDAYIPDPTELTAKDMEMLGACHQLLPSLRSVIDDVKLHRATRAISAVVQRANRYIDSQAAPPCQPNRTVQ